MIAYQKSHVWPSGGVPTLYEIGVGLGRTARFAGQTKHYYTVLAHTLTVAALVEPEHRLHALLHDAPEAIMGDVPTTWKTDEAKALEKSLLQRIYDSLGIPRATGVALNAVAAADKKALVAEAHVLGHAEPGWWSETPDGAAMTHTHAHLRLVPAYLDADEAGSFYEGRVLFYLPTQLKAAA